MKNIQRSRSLLPGASALLISFAAHVALASDRMPTLESLGEGWSAVDTDGVCSTGTPHKFFVRPFTGSQKLMIFFNGGGACWFGQQCDLNAKPTTHTPFAEMDQNYPAKKDGIFKFDREGNPFSDYNIVFLPYCTGDVHIGGGAKTYTYTNDAGAEVAVEVRHAGYSNSKTVLDWTFDNFATPENVVVTGVSAGAIGASFYAGIVAEKYNGTPVVLLADAAGGYNSPNLSLTFESWDTASILPNWPVYEGETNKTLNFEDFYIAGATHADNLTIAQYNAANDETQKNFTLLLGDAPDSFSIPQRILNHYAEIEDAVTTFYTYTANGSTHTILSAPYFYTYEVEGVKFSDWLAGLVAGEAVGDVSCVDDARGCAVEFVE